MTMFPRHQQKVSMLELMLGQIVNYCYFPEKLLLKTPRALITYGRLSDYIMDSNQLVHISLTLLPLNLSLMKGERICTRD